jgi:hypothetical protein
MAGRIVKDGRGIAPMGWVRIGLTAALLAGTLAVLAWMASEVVSSASVPQAVPKDQQVGWNNFETWFLVFEAIALMWIAVRWAAWRPGVKDGFVRNLSKEEIARRRRDDRHPARTWQGWSEVIILLFVLAPGLVFASQYAHTAKPAYDDRRQGLVSLARRCPALKPEIDALIAKGVPTSEQVVSMRVRAKVITKAPMRGQVCSVGAVS